MEECLSMNEWNIVDRGDENWGSRRLNAARNAMAVLHMSRVVALFPYLYALMAS